MKKYLSMLLLAAACILTGCEQKEQDPEVEKAKLTIVNNTNSDIYVFVSDSKYSTSDEYIIHESLSSGGSISKLINPGTYIIEGVDHFYCKDYTVTLNPGDDKTVSFR